MDNYYEKLKAWKELQKVLLGIPDLALRKTYHDAFLLKAMEEWGFNPDDPTQKPEELSESDLIKYLEPWEQELLKRIKAFNEYGIDIKPKEERRKEAKEAYQNMWEFIKGGGTLVDLPKDLRDSEHIQNLYFDS